MSGTVRSTLRRAAAIWAVNGRRMTRDRRVAFAALVLPVLIMALVGGVFGSGGKRLPVGVVDGDRSALSARAVTLIARSDQLAVHRYTSASAVRRDIRRNRILAGLAIPAGYQQRLLAGGAVAAPAVYQVGQGQALAARGAIVAALDNAAAEVVAARVAGERTGLPLAVGLRRAAAVTDASWAHRPPDPARLSPYAYTAPSNLVLFAFIMALATAAGFVETRGLGVIRRMLATPTSAAAIVVGEAAGLWVVAAGESLLLLVVGQVLFGVHFGSPAAVAALIVLLSAAAAGAGMLVATLSRTPEQALAVAIPVGIGLGMLGGCMWSLDMVGPAMRRIGHLFPQAWAMDGFVNLVYHHGTVASIAGSLAALAAFAAVLLSAGSLLLRRAVAAGG